MPMTTAIEFNKAAFREMYPNFANLSDAVLNTLWINAGLCSGINSRDCRIVTDDQEREYLMFLLLVHLATLQQRGDATVGTMTSASEGSVSGSFAMPPITANNWWYMQTRYGAMFWQVISRRLKGGLYFSYVPN